ncbi:helix-turn-helix domain-containing protein [Enterococcus durans]|uniref:helix-turn-helix domain-containing protein n=1 Tax=Enterococcus durans TaxID=53345 RepID=UPI0039A40E8A
MGKVNVFHSTLTFRSTFFIILLEKVATKTGVSRPSLSNIERRITSTSINNLWEISKGLPVPITYFFSEKNTDHELISLRNTKK